MPSIVQSVNVNTNSGTVNIGDTLCISHTSNTKEITGQGGSNTGNMVNTLNGANFNNVLNGNVVDQASANVPYA